VAEGYARDRKSEAVPIPSLRKPILRKPILAAAAVCRYTPPFEEVVSKGSCRSAKKSAT
jgi:hypothetical protein